MYFWRQDESVLDDQTRETVSDESLVSIFYYWLVDLAGPGQMRAKRDPALRWLSDSGLLDAPASSHIEVSAVQ